MPAEVDDVQIDSSTITDAVPEYVSPENMTTEQRNDWLLKGEIPLAGETPETSPTSNEEIAVTDQKPGDKPAPASQPELQKQTQRQPKAGKGETPAQKRIRELLAENAALKALKPAETGVTRTSPAAQPATEQQPAAGEKPADPKPVRASKPDGKPWKDWNEYEEAKDAWLIREGSRQALKGQDERTAQQSAQQAEQQIKTQWTERCTKAETDPEMPDFKDTAFKSGLMINQTTKAFLYTSDMGPKILYTLQKNPQVALQLANADALTTARVLVTLENALSGGKPAAGERQPAAPVASKTRKQSQTPDPVIDLGGRNSAGANEEEAAVRNDDFRKFYELETRKATASR